MIVVRLLGGLGNQMFQYASGFSVASKSNTNLAMDTSWFKTNNSVAAPRSYELDCFDLSYGALAPSQYTISTESISPLKRLLSKKKTLLNYSEKSLQYDAGVFEAGSDLFLDGYWQSEQYFKNCRDDILKQFSFKFEPTGNNKTVAQLIKSSVAVSLHVRRGDYANHTQTNSVHGLSGLNYYQVALKSISSRVKGAHFFIFSDDLSWCQENLKIKQPHTFVTGNKKGCYDMQLMSLCRHHIIANSSFSWWGAWLNPQSEKIVIAPKKWFQDPSLDARDLVPSSWEKL